YGTIRSEWKQTAGDYRIQVSVPANTTAKISLPATDAQQVKTYGLPLSASADVKFAGTENGKLWVTVGSGTYQFEVNKNR
ncbi:MAG: hypothetical protein LBN71_10755, partial [Tannerella sp.]|nr:hypothetical protein [Tannerella sp.]